MIVNSSLRQTLCSFIQRDFIDLDFSQVDSDYLDIMYIRK